MIAMRSPAGKRILVCDDEPHIVRLIEINLKRQGWDVQCARSGEEAVGLLERRPFDLAILDLHMPGVMGGCEVLEWIRIHEATKGMLVWMLASEEEAMLYGPCRQHRADRYEPKPPRFWDDFRR